MWPVNPCVPAVGDLAHDLAEDERVYDGVQCRAALGVPEDDGAELLAVDRAVGGDDRAAEGLDDAREPFAPGRVDPMADLVGVDDVGAELGEHAADDALPRADTAREPDDHGRLVAQPEPLCNNAAAVTRRRRE